MVDILNGVGINWIYFKMETTQILFLVQTDIDRVITEKKIRFTDRHQSTLGKNYWHIIFCILLTNLITSIRKGMQFKS